MQPINQSKVDHSHKPIRGKLSAGQSPSKDLIKLRSRIFKIIDEQFYELDLRIQKQRQLQSLHPNVTFSHIAINESRLEDWVQMLRNELLIIKPAAANEQTHSNKNQSKILDFPQPNSLTSHHKLLCHIKDHQLKLFECNQQIGTKEQLWKKTPYCFPQGVVKSHSSLTHVPTLNQLILIGGCKPTNPNIKSSKILSLNLVSSELQTLGNLPYGLSSHSAVYHQPTNSIYIIGGNRNHSIVTRGCFRFGLEDAHVEEISCLNYPVSSATCIIWMDEWIYKFGGVGEAFGEWNTSPYIQRYSMEVNEWQVVNPIIPQNLPLNHMFLTHTAAYICQDPSKIFVFGGYSIQGQFKDYAFLLAIQNSHNPNEDTHIIQEHGRVKIGQIRTYNNGIVVAKNLTNATCLFGLAQREHTGKVEPVLVHQFGS